MEQYVSNQAAHELFSYFFRGVITKDELLAKPEGVAIAQCLDMRTDGTCILMKD